MRDVIPVVIKKEERKMKKKLLSALLVVAMTATMLAGCGGKGSEEAKKGEEGKGKETTVEFWTIDLKATFGDFFNTMIANYEKEHKGVKIHWTDIPYADIQSKLVTAVAGGNAPDVVNLNTKFALTLAGENALVDLNKEATEEQKSIYIPDLWESAKIEDSVYAFPWYASPNIMFYNEELFKKAGMEVPKTYEEALGMCEEFYNKTGAYLFQPDEFFYLLHEEDMPILSEDGKKAVFNTPEVASLLGEYKTYTDKNILPKTGWGSWDEALKLFESGKLAIISSSGSSLSRVKDEAPDIYKTMKISTPLVGRTGCSRNPLMNLVVPSASKHQKEAIDFAHYVTNDENQLAFCKEVAIFPSTVKASEDPFFTSNTDTLEGQANAMSAKASKTSKDFALGITQEDNVQNAINKAYEASIINGDDITKALDQAAKDVEKLINE